MADELIGAWEGMCPQGEGRQFARTGETGSPEGSIPSPPGAYNPRDIWGVKGLSVRWEEVFRGCCRHLSGTLGVFRFAGQTPQIVSECHLEGSPSFTSYKRSPASLCAFPRGTEG